MQYKPLFFSAVASPVCVEAGFTEPVVLVIVVVTPDEQAVATELLTVGSTNIAFQWVSLLPFNLHGYVIFAPWANSLESYNSYRTSLSKYISFPSHLRETLPST